MSGATVRAKFMRGFSGMQRYSHWLAWSIVGFYLVLILAAIAAGHYMLSLPLSWTTGLLMAATSIFIGTRLRGLNNIVHECSHSSFSSQRGDNVRIGRFCSAILTGCFETYKRDHLSHHAHLGDYEHDNEFGPIERFGLHEDVTVKTVARLFVTPLLGLHLRAYSGINLSRMDGWFFFGLKILFLVSIVAFTIAFPLTSVFFVMLPLFYIFPTLNFWTDCLDHAGLVGETDELKASRNVLAPAPIRFLFFPRNDCYHLVHHLFPQIPARHLETAHHVLSEDSSYGSETAAIGTVRTA
jgi:fatty acid desaturase